MATEPIKDSSLVEHAKKEMKLVKLDTLGGSVGPKVMSLVEMLASQENDPADADVIIRIFYSLAQFMPLTPVTNEPDEWNEITKEVYSEAMIESGMRLWQSKRAASVFSEDGGKTWEDKRDGTSGKSLTREEALNGIQIEANEAVEEDKSVKRASAKNEAQGSGEEGGEESDRTPSDTGKSSTGPKDSKASDDAGESDPVEGSEPEVGTHGSPVEEREESGKESEKSA